MAETLGEGPEMAPPWIPLRSGASPPRAPSCPVRLLLLPCSGEIIPVLQSVVRPAMELSTMGNVRPSTMQAQTLPNVQASWVSARAQLKAIPQLIILWGVMVIVQLTWWSSIPGHVSFLWALLIAIVPCILVYVYGTRKGEATVRRWAPDRISIESDRLMGHFEGRSGPGNATTVVIPFGAITEVRVQSHLTQVNTIWGKSSAKAIYATPPMVPDRTGAPLTAAAVMMLTPENGPRVNGAWNAWRFPAQQAGTTCPRCGRQVPTGAQFCPSCSARVDGQTPPVTYSAPNPARMPGTPTPRPPAPLARARTPSSVAAHAALPSASSNVLCPRCKGEATFIPQYGQSYCYTCSAYV